MSGLLVSETDSRCDTAQYSYDGHRRLVATIDPDGEDTTDSYDAAGNSATVTDQRGKALPLPR